MITERDLVGCRCFTIENGDLSSDIEINYNYKG